MPDPYSSPYFIFSTIVIIQKKVIVVSSMINYPYVLNRVKAVIIFRYLAKEVYGTLLATTGVLLLVLISNQFVHYLTEAAAGVLPVHTVMQMMSLQVPLLLGLLLPLGMFLGILMAYGRLYVDQEMTVFSACGFSRVQLLRITFIMALVLAMIVAFLMLWMKPKMELYKRHILADAAASSPLERIFAGQFVSLENGKLVIYTQDLSRDHQQLSKVFIAQPPTDLGGKPWSVMVASGGYQWTDPQSKDRFIIFKNGSRYNGIPGTRDFQVATFDTYGVRIEQFAPPKLKRTETMSTAELWRQRHGHPDIHAELQWRISLPLSVLILSLIAVPMSQINPRQGRFAKMLPAILIYVIYADLLFVAQAWLQKGEIPSGIGMWWVHVLMFIIALLLIGRYIGWRNYLPSQRGRA